MRSCHHRSDLFFLINFIEKSPGADAITPRIRSEIFEFLDIWSKMRMSAQLGVNKITKLFSNFPVAGLSNLLQVFLKLFGLEYSIFIQLNCLCAAVLPGSPGQYASSGFGLQESRPFQHHPQIVAHEFY